MTVADTAVAEAPPAAPPLESSEAAPGLPEVSMDSPPLAPPGTPDAVAEVAPPAPGTSPETAATAPEAVVAEDPAVVPAVPLVPAASEPAQVLSHAERRYLAKRNQIDRAVRAIEAAEMELAESEQAFGRAKKDLEAKKTAKEVAYKGLYHAEKNDPAPEQTSLWEEPAAEFLPDQQPSSNAPVATDAAPGDNANEAMEDYKAAMEQWETKWNNDFLAQKIDILQLPDGLCEKLREHSPRVDVLADLVKLQAGEDPRGYTQVNGIGKASADKIGDAYDRHQTAFLLANPQPKKPAAAPTTESAAQVQVPAEEAPAEPEYDFESSFPAPINPTVNENFDTEYHRNVINGATESLNEMERMQECLANNTAANGTPLTPTKRDKMQNALNDTQKQYEDGYRVYEEHFGKRAVERLMRYVNSKAKKKSTLKGGLE